MKLFKSLIGLVDCTKSVARGLGIILFPLERSLVAPMAVQIKRERPRALEKDREYLKSDDNLTSQLKMNHIDMQIDRDIPVKKTYCELNENDRFDRPS